MDLHLTASEKETFRQQGYIVKHNTVTLKQLETARDAVWVHLDGDRVTTLLLGSVGMEHKEWDVNQHLRR